MDPNCCVCGEQATGHAWVRPVGGGRRWTLHFCSDARCRIRKITAIGGRGWKATVSPAWFGYDEFIPLWESDELPAELR